MRYGIIDAQLDVWLRRKPAVRSKKVIRSDWQKKPTYPFRALVIAEETLAMFAAEHRAHYVIIPES